jgi:UDP-glucuronate 4-epimerase
MKGKRILVTGGAGFIGSHLCEALLRGGALLTIIDNLNDFYSPEWKQANLAFLRTVGTLDFFRCDICDLPELRRVFRASMPEIVIHLAAYAGVRPSIQRPHLYEQVNVAGTLNLLELLREFGVSKFVFGSSSSVYGDSSKPPFREDDVQLRPISPYAATKLAGELLAYTYAHLYGISTVCLRFFTVYGPRQRPDLAIHKFTAMIEAGIPIPVFGDGSTGRDYTFVADIVAGVLAAIAYDPVLRQRSVFEVFNLGNSSPVTLNQLIATIEELTNNKAIRNVKPLQPGDVQLTWADTAKSERLLEYKPSTPLRTGLSTFIEWYRNSPAELRLSYPAVGATSP